MRGLGGVVIGWGMGAVEVAGALADGEDYGSAVDGVAADGDVGTEGLGDYPGGDDLFGGAHGVDRALVEDGDALAVLGGQGDVVHGCEDADACFGAHLLNEVKDGGLVADVEVGCGFVQEKQGGFLGEGAGDEYALSFAAGEGGDGTGGELDRCR